MYTLTPKNREYYQKRMNYSMYQLKRGSILMVFHIQRIIGDCLHH